MRRKVGREREINREKRRQRVKLKRDKKGRTEGYTANRGASLILKIMFEF